MRYLVSSFFVLLLVNWNTLEASANGPTGPDSNSNIHDHIIRDGAPFLYIAGQTQVGDLQYEFDYSNKASHASYDVNFTSIGFEVGAGLRIKGVGAYLGLGYGFLSYYAGHHFVTDTVEHNGASKIYLNQIVTEHKYPRRVYLGVAGLEYRIRLSQSIQFVPFVEGKLWKYPDNRFFPKAGKDDVSFELQDNYSLGGGLTFKAILSENSNFSMKFCYLQNNFNPVGYFDSVSATNLKISTRSVEISLVYEFSFNGYQFGLFNERFSFY